MVHQFSSKLMSPAKQMVKSKLVSGGSTAVSGAEMSKEVSSAAASDVKSAVTGVSDAETRLLHLKPFGTGLP